MTAPVIAPSHVPASCLGPGEGSLAQPATAMLSSAAAAMSMGCDISICVLRKTAAVRRPQMAAGLRQNSEFSPGRQDQLGAQPADRRGAERQRTAIEIR